MEIFKLNSIKMNNFLIHSDLEIKDLKEKELMVIIGDTGAGKTTAFGDAIKFGLYGVYDKVSKQEELLSNFLPLKEDKGFVELGFIGTNGSKLNIHRRFGLKPHHSALKLDAEIDGQIIKIDKKKEADNFLNKLGFNKKFLYFSEMINQKDVNNFLRSGNAETIEIFKEILNLKLIQKMKKNVENNLLEFENEMTDVFEQKEKLDKQKTLLKEIEENIIILNNKNIKLEEEQTILNKSISELNILEEIKNKINTEKNKIDKINTFLSTIDEKIQEDELIKTCSKVSVLTNSLTNTKANINQQEKRVEQINTKLINKKEETENCNTTMLGKIKARGELWDRLSKANVIIKEATPKFEAIGKFKNDVITISVLKQTNLETLESEKEKIINDIEKNKEDILTIEKSIKKNNIDRLVCEKEKDSISDNYLFFTAHNRAIEEGLTHCPVCGSEFKNKDYTGKLEGFHGDKKEVTKRIKEIKEKIKDYELEKKSLNDQKNKYINNLGALEKDLKTNSEKIKDYKTAFEKFNKEIKIPFKYDTWENAFTFIKTYNSYLDKKTELQTKESNLITEVKQLEDYIAKNKIDIKDLENELKLNQTELKSEQNKKQDIESEIKNALPDNISLEKALIYSNQEYMNVKKEKAFKQELLKEYQDNLNVLTKKLSEQTIGNSEINLTIAKEKVKQINKEISSNIETIGGYKNEINNYNKNKKELDQKILDSKDIHQKIKVHEELKNALQNGKFPKYATSKMLEIIFDKANEILADFFEGKYELESDSELNKFVFDSEVGEKRNSTTLSGGEEMFVTLAITFANSALSAPGFLIIDEGFNSLDETLIPKAFDILQAFASSINKTVMVISHDTNFIELFKNKAMISQNKIVWM